VCDGRCLSDRAELQPFVQQPEPVVSYSGIETRGDMLYVIDSTNSFVRSFGLSNPDVTSVRHSLDARRERIALRQRASPLCLHDRGRCGKHTQVFIDFSVQANNTLIYQLSDFVDLEFGSYNTTTGQPNTLFITSQRNDRVRLAHPLACLLVHQSEAFVDR
jgi:hypothetical protein